MAGRFASHATAEFENRVWTSIQYANQELLQKWIPAAND